MKFSDALKCIFVCIVFEKLGLTEGLDFICTSNVVDLRKEWFTLLFTSQFYVYLCIHLILA